MAKEKKLVRCGDCGKKAIGRRKIDQKTGLCKWCLEEVEQEKKEAEARAKCKKKGYHNWEIIGVAATLPTQELSLCCKDCEVEADCSFECYD